jgi:uncharacterized Zn-binding protein involved in type VI secretion
MPRVICLGDTGSHGGLVSTASPDVWAQGRRVARVGDMYDCPEHGPNPIVSGSPNTTANGQAIARVGDTTACGATLIGGATATLCN